MLCNVQLNLAGLPVAIDVGIRACIMIEKMMANVLVAAPIQIKSTGHCSFKAKV
jgi:hypothetical protein